MPATTLYPKQTAKVLRTVLAKAFPNTKFSITTGRGAGVSAVDVRWMDGPTVREVDAIVGPFEIGSFNGMTDSYEYSKREDRQLLVDGVHYEAGCRYVMTARSLSAAKANECIKQVAEFWGGVDLPLPVAIDTKYGYEIADGRGNERVRADLSHQDDWSSMIHRCAADPSRFTREVVAAPAPAKPVQGYRDQIMKSLIEIDRADVSPVYVEGWMRLAHPTLDGLHAHEFHAEVVIAVKCCDIEGEAASRSLAESYGLGRYL